MPKMRPVDTKATAVPKKGAEHGVASSVAKAPSAKLPFKPPRFCVARRVVMAEGRLISNRPSRLAVNSAVTITIKLINHGFWN